MENNCHECTNSYLKDLFMDGTELVDICSCDNAYIGYPEDAEKEQCRFKTVKCIRSWSECSKVIRDTFTGNLFATNFVEAFKVGNCYKILSEENGTYKIYNEQCNISEFGAEITNFFEMVA